MPRSASKSRRSKSRGRPPKESPKSSSKNSKIKAEPKKFKMEFQESDNVMARWPGTSLYYEAVVTFAREDDNEYDVLYADGTVFTIPAKDVTKSITSRKERGRSPARSTRKRSPSRKQTPTRQRSSSRATRAPKPAMTPTRSSARLAQAKIELSGDEEDGVKAIPNPELPLRKKKSNFFSNLSFGWIFPAFCMMLGPAITIYLHDQCSKGKCTLQPVKLSQKWQDYYDRDSLLATFAFLLVVKLLSLIPLGKTIKSASGKEVRLNGFYGIVAISLFIGGLVFKNVDLSFVTKNYFHLMLSSIVLSVVLSFFAYVWSFYENQRKSNLNPKGTTGNFVADFYYGRSFNPYFWLFEMKLILFRFSMMSLAVLNAMLIIHSMQARKGQVNVTTIMASALQVFYACDSLFHEEFYFFAHDAMNTGFGFQMISSYNTFPFIPTLLTRYMIAKNFHMTNLSLTATVLVNVVGTFLFRSSENIRVEFAKNPSNPAFKDSIQKRVLTTGLFGIVRHPNYLGEILIKWSWAIPAGALAFVNKDFLVFYLPVYTTLILIYRIFEQESRNERKYGNAWHTYCDRVKSKLIPKVY